MLQTSHRKQRRLSSFLIGKGSKISPLLLSPDFNCQPDIYPPTAQIHYIALGICMNHSHRNKDGYITREEFTKVYKKLLELQE